MTTDDHQGKPGISNGLDKFVRDLTDKSRVLGQEENDSARTGQASSQELRIAPHSQEETDKPSAKAKLKPSSSSLQHLLWNKLRFMRGNVLILNRLRKGTVL